jgi:SAM-dependent methyltransferase
MPLADHHYALDNADTGPARVRMACLAELYDQHTVAALDANPVRRGGRGLDVGTGGGSTAHLIADHLGPGAVVHATDLDPRHAAAAGRDAGPVRLFTHDVEHDPLPVDGEGYDVIHARLVLMHCADPGAALARLVAVLRPGGLIIVGELDPMTRYAADDDTPEHQVINRVGGAFSAALARAGADNTRGRFGHRHLTAAGLVEVSNAGHVAVGTPISAATRLMHANVTQLHDTLLRAGVTVGELAGFHAALEDPASVWFMPTFFLATGRRPR